jgi:pyruvate/2-oxoglutarate dehydrogenase complex dihydrolipoamide acyltransferase (E2) component
MAEEGEDLVVNLNAEPEVEAKVEAKPPPVPGPPAAVEPQVGLQDLQLQIANERRARAAVEDQARRIAAERDQAVRYAQEAEQRGGNNYEAYVDSQIQGMTGEMDNLAAHAEVAMNEGDFKTAAAINKQLGRIGGALAIAEREKQALQQQRQQPQQPRQQPQQQQPQRQVPTDPVERAIANRTPATQAFLRKHPELIRGDGTLKKIAIDAHDKALDAGHAVDTEGYFRYVESSLGGNGQAPSENGAAPRIPGYSAPVTRGPAPGGDNLAPGTFRLTPKMRRLAEEQGVTPSEWATNYVKLLKEGRITPIT